MLEYYSVWNFSWFLLRAITPEKNVIRKMDRGLFISVLSTAVVGGFMSYIYPRSLHVRYKNFNRRMNFGVQLVACDFLVHQVPLLFALKEKIYLSGSSVYSLVVISVYRGYVYLFHKNKTPYALHEKYAYVIPISFIIYDFVTSNKEAARAATCQMLARVNTIRI